MQIKYVGIFDVADIPALDLVGVPRGTSIDVGDEIAESLLEQPANWQRAEDEPSDDASDDTQPASDPPAKKRGGGH